MKAKKERLYNKAIKKAEHQQKQGFHEGAALAWLEAATLLPQDEYPDAIVDCLDKAGFTSDSSGEYLKAELASVLKNLGNVYYEKCEFDKAETYFQQALLINEKTLHKEHPDIAGVLKSLGDVYYEKGEIHKAESHFQRALVVSEKTLHKEHPNIASILNNLGCVYYEKGEFDKAELYFQRALIIRKKLLGKECPDISKVSGNLVDCIKEINRLTQENLENRTALYQANRFTHLGKMVAMMAHNMNNPVGIIHTTASAVLTNTQEQLFDASTELQPILENIVEQTEQLNVIINNFKNFVAGDRTVMTAINLNNIINDVYQLIFDVPYQLDTIQLIKNFTEPSPITYANNFSLQEIVISLLSNARDAVKNKAIKTVRISTWQENNNVGFTIEDSGDGMNEEQLHKLFTPLLTAKNEGRGLSLYFCKTICKKLGGDISHYSTLEGGTAFRISLQAETK